MKVSDIAELVLNLALDLVVKTDNSVKELQDEIARRLNADLPSGRIWRDYENHLPGDPEPPKSDG
jgi:hypothetical protein